MGPGDVTSRAAVESAMREYDEMGRESFLTKYGFKRSTKFVVVHNRREYDSKALLAAAHGFQHPDEGPLLNNFSGGEQTTARFRALGFTIVFPTTEILADVRSAFGDRFVPSRVEAEQEAAALLNARAGEMTREDAFKLGELFNRHERSGRVRQDRFSPGFVGATMQKVTEDLERFNLTVADLWTAPVDAALTRLGEMFADRSQLPGAGSSLPSMLLYLRDPERFAVCINATMNGLATAYGGQFKAGSRQDYETFCAAVRDWRDRYGIAPQEADAVLTSLWRASSPPGSEQGPAAFVFGNGPLQFLADLASNNSGSWMDANRQRYREELRRPFVTLLERIAAGYLRELDPKLDTTVKANRVLALIRKRFPDEQGEYYSYLWGAFSRGRKQDDVQLSVLVQPKALEAGLYLGSASSAQRLQLHQALRDHGDALLAGLDPYMGRLAWETEDRENPLAPRTIAEVANAADAAAWLDGGGTSIKWILSAGDPLLDDPSLPEEFGKFFQVLHPLAAAAWGDAPAEELTSDDQDDEEVPEVEGRLTVEQVAGECYLPVEMIEQWVTALQGPMRQGMFYGPPGTGKTYVARQLARHLATSPAHAQVAQFHPSYSYEDFIEGLRPEPLGDTGILRYSVRPGLFQEFCNRARTAREETFVFIIDEMNRADLAAVFGELLMLLEYRGEVVVLPYSQQRFSVPRNVILLGTMNTADRSLALVDFALRRRFNAFHLPPSPEVLAQWASKHAGANAGLLVDLFKLVCNRVGTANPVTPGHSYWMIDDADPAAIGRVWEYQVYPYLAEHWFEQPAQLTQLDADVRALIAERS